MGIDFQLRHLFLSFQFFWHLQVYKSNCLYYRFYRVLSLAGLFIMVCSWLLFVQQTKKVMKRLTHIIILIIPLLMLFSCRKDFNGPEPEGTHTVKSMNDLKVPSDFDWKTTKTLNVRINLPDDGTLQLLTISKTDGSKVYFRGYPDDGSRVLRTKITVPAAENMLQLTYGDGNQYAPVNVGIDQTTLTYAFSTNFKEARDVCGPCNGQVNHLKLQYLGSEANPVIRVTQKKGSNHNYVIFNNNVIQNGIFDFDGANNPNHRMGSAIKIYVNSVLNTSIHTSCSQTILAGMQFGDFLIVSGTSVNGGPLCPVPGGNTAPTATFTVTPSCGSTSTGFGFDASGVTDAEDPAALLAVRWDFDGDGTWDTPYSTTKTITHQYTTEGSYSPKMEVKDTGGLTDVVTGAVTVSNSGCGGTTVDYEGTLAYEDLWPSKGDYDFNDLVINYNFHITKNSSEQIQHITGTFTIYAFGAGFYNGFGFTLPNVDPSQISSVTGYELKTNSIHTLAANGLEAGQSKATVIVYDDSFDQMQHPGMGIGVNTTPWAPYVTPKTLTIEMAFDLSNPITFSQLDIGNFNPFIIVNQQRGVEVHLPGYDPSDLADQSYFDTFDDASSTVRNYVTATNLPWAINLPVVFEYPIEKVDITQVYYHFAEWAESGGQLYPDWYEDNQGYRNSSLIYTHN